MKIKNLLISTLLLGATAIHAQRAIYSFENGDFKNDLGTGNDAQVFDLVSNSNQTSNFAYYSNLWVPDRNNSSNTQAINLGSDAGLNLGLDQLGSSTSFAITMWLTKGAANGRHGILRQNNNAGFNQPATSWISIEGAGNQLYFSRGDGCSGGTNTFVDPGSGSTIYSNIADGAWYHLTAMYNSTTTNLEMYINGSFYASVTGAGGTCLNNQWGLEIGFQRNPSNLASGIRGLGGKVDDIQIYGNVLTPAQITTIYNLPARGYLAKIVTQPESFCNVPASISVSATGENLSYLWSNGSTTSAIVANTPGAYTVTVSGYGKVVSKTVVAGSIAPVIVTQPSISTNIACRNPTLSVSATGINLNYKWSSIITNSASVTAIGSQTYNVTVSSANCASVVSNDLTVNLVDCIGDFAPRNGSPSGNGGYFGTIEGYITGTCSGEQMAVFSTNITSTVAGFDDSRTQLDWYYSRTGDLANDRISLPSFANQKKITISGQNLTFGGYFAVIKTCGNGNCTFRNFYTTPALYLSQMPTLTGISVLNSPSGATTENPYYRCTNITTAIPKIKANFNGFITNYNWFWGGDEDNGVSATSTPLSSDINAQFYSYYQLNASNYCGSVSATYTILGANVPQITLRNTNIVSCSGSTILIPHTVTGYQTFSANSILYKGTTSVRSGLDVFSILGANTTTSGTYSIENRNTCGNGISQNITLTVNACPTTDLKDLAFDNSNRVTIYPNPSTGDFKVNNAKSVTVYDLLGKIVLSTTETTFTISNKGLFIAHLETASGKKFVKLVVE